MEMEAEEMTDVLHYLFEDDLLHSTPEQAEAQSRSRTVVYESLYGRAYKYKMKGTSGSGSGNYQTYADGSHVPSDGFYGGQDVDEFDPTAQMVSKPYVPPTEFNPESPLPFGRDLDAPLN